MACSIKFVRLDDFIADIDELDLSANGYSLAEDGYFPVVAPIDARTVSESITLKLKGTSKDDLAAMTQELNEIVKQVQWWLENPGVERYQVWIRVQQENETYPRQAQIVNILPPDRVEIFKPEEWRDNYIGNYTFGIERTAFWEDPYTYPTTTAKTGLNIIGGMVQLSETINGDVPARLAKVSLTPSTGSQYLSSFWIGFRTNRLGVAANLTPVWPIFETGLFSTDTLPASDSSAYGGTRVSCDFSVATTLSLRAFLYMQDITANPADQRGSYLVLMRAKMSDTSVARARIAYSFGDGGSVIYSPAYRSRVVISGTSWTLYEMGTIDIPPSRTFSSYELGNFAITIDAERISGSGNLDMDCFVMIPITEGAIKLTSAGRIAGGVNSFANVFGAADGSLKAFAEITGNFVSYPITVSPINWSLPANGEAPRVVVAASDSTAGTVKARTLDLTYTYIPRFRTLRGNVT